MRGGGEGGKRGGGGERTVSKDTEKEKKAQAQTARKNTQEITRTHAPVERH